MVFCQVHGLVLTARHVLVVHMVVLRPLVSLLVSSSTLALVYCFIRYLPLYNSPCFSLLSEHFG